MAVKLVKFISLEKRDGLLNSFERNILRRMFGPARGNGMWILKCNEEFYGKFKILALNLRDYKVLDTYEDSLLSLCLRNSEN